MEELAPTKSRTQNSLFGRKIGNCRQIMASNSLPSLNGTGVSMSILASERNSETNVDLNGRIELVYYIY